MRLMMSIACVVLLSACSSAPDVAEDDPGGETVAAIPDNLYQPTVHAILAVGGGYQGAGGASGEVATLWRRAGTNQSVRLELSPDAVTVRPMPAGRYALAGVVVNGRDVTLVSDGPQAGSPMHDVVLDPGDVIYVGDLVISDQGGSAGTPDMVLRVRRNESQARQAVAARYTGQAPRMQTRLLRRR